MRWEKPESEFLRHSQGNGTPCFSSTHLWGSQGWTLCKADLDPCKRHLVFLWMKPVGHGIWKSGCSKHAEPYVTGTPLRLSAARSLRQRESSLKWASQLTLPPRDSNALKEGSFYDISTNPLSPPRSHLVTLAPLMSLLSNIWHDYAPGLGMRSSHDPWLSQAAAPSLCHCPCSSSLLSPIPSPPHKRSLQC